MSSKIVCPTCTGLLRRGEGQVTQVTLFCDGEAHSTPHELGSAARWSCGVCDVDFCGECAAKISGGTVESEMELQPDDDTPREGGDADEEEQQLTRAQELALARQHKLLGFSHPGRRSALPTASDQHPVTPGSESEDEVAAPLPVQGGMRYGALLIEGSGFALPTNAMLAPAPGLVEAMRRRGVTDGEALRAAPPDDAASSAGASSAGAIPDALAKGAGWADAPLRADESGVVEGGEVEGGGTGGGLAEGEREEGWEEDNGADEVEEVDESGAVEDEIRQQEQRRRAALRHKARAAAAHASVTRQLNGCEWRGLDPGLELGLGARQTRSLLTDAIPLSSAPAHFSDPSLPPDYPEIAHRLLNEIAISASRSRRGEIDWEAVAQRVRAWHSCNALIRHSSLSLGTAGLPVHLSDAVSNGRRLIGRRDAATPPLSSSAADAAAAPSTSSPDDSTLRDFGAKEAHRLWRLIAYRLVPHSGPAEPPDA